MRNQFLAIFAVIALGTSAFAFGGEQTLLTIQSDHPDYLGKDFILKLVTNADGEPLEVVLDNTDHFTIGQIESAVGATIISRSVFLIGTWNVLRIKSGSRDPSTIGKDESTGTIEEFPKMRAGTEKVDTREGCFMTLTWLHEKSGLSASRYKHLEIELRKTVRGEWALHFNGKNGRLPFHKLFVQKRPDDGNGIQDVQPILDAQ